jgi:hypothetical protein
LVGRGDPTTVLIHDPDVRGRIVSLMLAEDKRIAVSRGALDDPKRSRASKALDSLVLKSEGHWAVS